MKLNKAKIIYLIAVMAISIIVIHWFFASINFCGEISVNVNFTQKENEIQFFANSPINRKVDFIKLSNKEFFIKGYYKSLFLEVPKNFIQYNLKSMTIAINGKQIRLNKNNFLNFWDFDHFDNNLSVYSLNSNVTSIGFFYKILCFLTYTYHPFVFFISLCLIFLILLNLKKLKQKFFPWFHNITPKKVLLICSCVFLIYSLAFGFTIKYQDTIEISEDYTVYQTEAVNFIKGNKLNNQTISEKYKYNTLDIDSSSYVLERYNCQTANIYTVPPVYPLFLSIIYKVFGVSPMIARYCQLLLFLIVASFISMLLYYLMGNKGFILGIIAGFFFITKYYYLSNEIMTEPLMIFFNFLSLCAVTYFERKKSYLSAILLGFTLAVALLVKGIIVFFILFYFIAIIYRYFKHKDNIFLRKIMVLIFVFLLSLVPWLVYSNLHSGIIQRLDVSKDELVLDKDFLNSVVANVPGLKTDNQIDSVNHTLISHRFQLTQISQFLKKPSILKELSIEKIKANINNITSAIDQLLSSPCFKLSDKNYFYYRGLEKLVIISTNHTQNILEANNENCADGGWHQNDSIKYVYDKDVNSPSILRVMHFYWTHPGLILVIFPNKLYAGYHNFPFFLLLIALILANFVFVFTENKISELNVLKKLFFLLLIPGILFLENYNVISFTLIMAITFLMICFAIIRKKQLEVQKLPLSFNLLISNFILITLIFYGNDRFTSVIDFVFIISAIYCFFEYYSKILGFRLFADSTVFKSYQKNERQ
jgi:hypothetical protein